MANTFKKKAEYQDHLLRQTRLVMGATVVANAVPASKTHVTDVPGMSYLRTEGKTAEADAVESLTAQVAAPVDSTGVCAVLLDEQVEKVYKVTVTPSVGTATAALTISTGGRMIVALDSNQDLSTTSVTFTLEVEYKAKPNN